MPLDASIRERPIAVLIAALGGEGGGVLTEWLVSAAVSADLPVQATSIPGVAQRTGATTYYVEIFPKPNAELGGRRPLFGLYPSPNGVDLVVASELIEAARAAENGFVTPERTTLIAATHRVYSTAEKAAPSDGRFDAARARRTVREMPRQAILFDPQGDAELAGRPLNAVLFGAMAKSGALPFDAEAYRRAIRDGGIAVEANLAAFERGLTLSAGATAEGVAASGRAASGRSALVAEAAARLPASVLKFAEPAIDRLIEYQDEAYARAFLDKIYAILDADRSTEKTLTAETARHLALWMSYEDVIRVADLKTRSDRFARVRAEVRANPEQPIRITEHFKPGLEEVAALLTPGLGRALRQWGEDRGWSRGLHVALPIKTTTVLGFLRLWLIARLRPWRRRTLRYAEEWVGIERWLSAIRQTATSDPAFALEIAQCAELLKGYSDTYIRGRRSFATIFERIVEPAIVSLPADRSTAARLKAARAAALADADGEAFAKFWSETPT
jgi:indolepyruvate ferredoxin oxidoreductase beta subunit